jgi:hypothetical protein
MRILGGCMALAVVVAGMGCGTLVGSGVSATTTREVGAFSAILIEVPLDATIAIGPEQPLELSGDDNVLSLIRTEVHGDALHVRPAQFSNIVHRVPLTLKVFTPALNAISAGASSTVTAADVQTSRMDIMANDASEVTITNLTTGTMDLHADGSSTVTLTGSAGGMGVTLSGASQLMASEFPVETATVALSGSSEGSLRVTGSISGAISEASTLTVSGNPANRDVLIESSATLSFR